jgi:hypothetical protein
VRSDSQSTRGEIGRRTDAGKRGRQREGRPVGRSPRVPRQRRHEDGRGCRELLCARGRKTNCDWATRSAERRRHPEVDLAEVHRLVGATRHLRHRGAVRTDARSDGSRVENRECQCKNECPAGAQHDGFDISVVEGSCQTETPANATRVRWTPAPRARDPPGQARFSGASGHRAVRWTWFAASLAALRGIRGKRGT